MIRLMIAEDHALMREGLKQLLRLGPDIEIVAEAVDGTGVLDKLRQVPIDLLLLDMSMPGISGEDLIGRIRLHYPDLHILVLSMHIAPQIAQRALKAGANGYVTKDRDPQTLLSAIRKVAEGGRFLDSQLAEEMAFDIGGNSMRHHSCLSDREFQVMRLLAAGETINRIAEQLAISNKTVSTHKARMMEKMGFDSNAELVRYALQHGLAQ